MLPGATVVTRREPAAGPALIQSGGISNDIHQTAVSPQAPPDPIRESDFYLEGKPFGHAASHFRIPIQLGINRINSIWDDNLSDLMGKHIFTNLVTLVRGAQTPLAERATIRTSQATAYGNSQVIDPVMARTSMPHPGRVTTGYWS